MPSAVLPICNPFWKRLLHRVSSPITSNRISLKLPFYRLNAVKAGEFERLTAINTEVANDLLKVHKSERSKLTSSAFRHIEKGRIPLAVHQASHAELLDQAIAGEAKLGSIKLCKSRKGIMTVP
jgi:hypothetical protein